MNAYRTPSPQDPLPAPETRSFLARHRALRLALLVGVYFVLTSIGLVSDRAGRSNDDSMSVVSLGLMAAGSLVAYGIMLWDKGTWR